LFIYNFIFPVESLSFFLSEPSPLALQAYFIRLKSGLNLKYPLSDCLILLLSML
jgi:hypothetical protein